MLGCKLKVYELQTWFPYPQEESSKVHVIFDTCQMIKLMRNLLCYYKTICHLEHQILHPIKWKDIEDLNTLQEDVGFTLANKLKRKHIIWTKHKMNVSLAAQTLSASVASSIDFLGKKFICQNLKTVNTPQTLSGGLTLHLIS